jgi:hypothetical protein
MFVRIQAYASPFIVQIYSFNFSLTIPTMNLQPCATAQRYSKNASCKLHTRKRHPSYNTFAPVPFYFIIENDLALTTLHVQAARQSSCKERASMTTKETRDFERELAHLFHKPSKIVGGDQNAVCRPDHYPRFASRHLSSGCCLQPKPRLSGPHFPFS